MRETFELIGAEIHGRRRGHAARRASSSPAAAPSWRGSPSSGRDVLQMPVRVVGPSGVGGLTDSILTPAYATSIGLLQWGASMLDEGEPARYESAPAAGSSAGSGRLGACSRTPASPADRPLR